MSCKVEKSELNRKQILEIKNDLFVEGVESEYGPAETLEVWGETGNSLYLPHSYYRTYFGHSPNKRDFPRIDFVFTGEYKDEEQRKIAEEALVYLKKQRSILISIFTGAGKTILAGILSAQTKCKTAVLVHRGILVDQWVGMYTNFTTAKVQVVDTNGELDPNADIYIFNIAFVPKRWNKETKSWVPKKLGQYREIGTLIVDEAHIACASEMSKAMLYFEP